jgi:hypothetical protein
MPTYRIAALFVIAVSSAGCAQLPHQGPAELPKIMKLTLNASPGRVRSLRGTHSSDRINEFRVTFDRLQPSQDWSPTVGICLHKYLAQVEEICLHLTADPNGTEGKATVTDWPEGQRRLLSAPGPRAQFKLNAPILVQLNRMDDGVDFLLNGERLHLSQGALSLKAFSMGCSSVVCTLEITR